MAKIRDERRGTATNPIEILKIIRKYYEQLYTKKMRWDRYSYKTQMTKAY